MKYIFSFIFLAILIACTSDNEQEYFPQIDCTTDNLYYHTSDDARSISSIISNKCVSCHNQGNMANVQYIILETYAQLSDLDNIVEVINRPADHQNPMPPVGSTQLTDCEKLQIENWITNGSLYDKNNR